ncbi:Dystroglycan-type cadherin-like protein [Lasiodiplodia theobromae]|nr:Dystroglycan-type cadherin-like protein [Lasiodiplodia theobromae]
MLLFILTLLLAAAIEAAPIVSFPLNSQVPPVARVSQPFDFQFSPGTFTGAAGSLEYSLSGSPTWLSLDSPNRRLYGSPTEKDIGAPSFTIIAEDATGLTPMQATLIVSADAAPKLNVDITDSLAKAGKLSGPRSLSLQPSEQFSIQFPTDTFTSSATADLTYYATLSDRSPLPSWVSFNPDSMVFSGTCSASSQTVDLMLVASDVIGFAGSSLVFTISVSTHQLFFSNVEQTVNVTAGSEVNIADLRSQLSLDGEALSDTDLKNATASPPSWLSFDPKTLGIRGTAPQDVNSTSFTISAADRFGDVANTTILLMAGSELFRGAVGNLNAVVGEPAKFDLSNVVAKQPGLQVEVDLGSAAQWLHFDEDSLTISGEIPSSAAPQEIHGSIKVTTADGSQSDTGSFDIVVKAAEATGSNPRSTSATANASTTAGSSETSSAGLAPHETSNNGAVIAVSFSTLSTGMLSNGLLSPTASQFPAPPPSPCTTNRYSNAENRKSVRIVPGSPAADNSTILADTRPLDERRQSYIRNRALSRSPFFAAHTSSRGSSSQRPSMIGTLGDPRPSGDAGEYAGRTLSPSSYYGSHPTAAGAMVNSTEERPQFPGSLRRKRTGQGRTARAYSESSSTAADTPSRWRSTNNGMIGPLTGTAPTESPRSSMILSGLSDSAYTTTEGTGTEEYSNGRSPADDDEGDPMDIDDPEELRISSDLSGSSEGIATRPPAFMTSPLSPSALRVKKRQQQQQQQQQPSSTTPAHHSAPGIVPSPSKEEEEDDSKALEDLLLHRTPSPANSFKSNITHSPFHHHHRRNRSTAASAPSSPTKPPPPLPASVIPPRHPRHRPKTSLTDLATITSRRRGDNKDATAMTPPSLEDFNHAALLRNSAVATQQRRRSSAAGIGIGGGGSGKIGGVANFLAPSSQQQPSSLCPPPPPFGSTPSSPSKKFQTGSSGSSGIYGLGSSGFRDDDHFFMGPGKARRPVSVESSPTRFSSMRGTHESVIGAAAAGAERAGYQRAAAF